MVKVFSLRNILVILAVISILALAAVIAYAILSQTNPNHSYGDAMFVYRGEWRLC